MTRENNIRKEILLQAYGCRSLALSAERIQRDARKEGYDFTVSEVKRELPFLVGEGLLKETAMPGVTEKYFEITSAGIRHYEQNLA